MTPCPKKSLKIWSRNTTRANAKLSPDSLVLWADASIGIPYRTAGPMNELRRLS